MASPHGEALKDDDKGCTTCSKPFSWHQIPSELLVMIMNKLPLSGRAAMSRVCQTWRTVIHSEASRILNNIKQKRLVDESQLTSLALDEANHDANTCNCIAMAYDKSPFLLNTKSKGFKACTRFGIFAAVIFQMLGLSHKL
jgi:hypothetical protein